MTALSALGKVDDAPDFTPKGPIQECDSLDAAIQLAERALWQDDDQVRWVPEAAYQTMVTEVCRLQEVAALSTRQAGLTNECQPHGMEREHYRLLYGFILDCNAIGPEEAGRNLARDLKESAALRRLAPTAKENDDGSL